MSNEQKSEESATEKSSSNSVFLPLFGVLIIASFVYFMISFLNSETQPSFQYEVVAKQGLMRFVHLGNSPDVNKNTYKEISNYICRDDSVCVVMFWHDKSLTPRSLPMSDAQVKHKVAHYNLNKNTGNDELLICAEDGC